MRGHQPSAHLYGFSGWKGQAVNVVLLARNPTDTLTYGLLPAAHELGLRVRILTDHPRAHRDRYADIVGIGRPEVMGCQVTDVRAVLATITASGPVHAVISNSDHLQVQTALVADYLQTPGKDWRSAQRARDKGLMRAHLAAADLDDTGCLRLVTGLPIPEPLPADLRFPAVLKPAEGVASEDVVMVVDEADLRRRVAQVRTRRPTEDLLLETLLDGPLQTLETFGDGQQIRVLGSWHTRIGAPPSFIEERLTWEPAPDPGTVSEILRLLGALGCGFGACHTEFVRTPAGPRLVEVNDRLIGDHCDLAMARLTGEPIFHDLLRLLLGEPLRVPEPGPSRAGLVHWVLADADGQLRSAPAPSHADRGGVEVEYRQIRPIGSAVRVTGTNRDYLGSVIVTGPDPVGVEAVAADFLSAEQWVIE